MTTRQTKRLGLPSGWRENRELSEHSLRKPMTSRNLPDTEYLHQCFSYDANDGTLTWQHRPCMHFATETEYKRWNATWPRKPAGTIAGSGHIYIKINKTLFAAHRIIWKMMTGEDPPSELDHKNRDRTDNRWANLRQATREENARNKTRYQNNTSGFKGVRVTHLTYPHPYQARIRVNGNLIHLGSFRTAQEAQKTYAAAAKHYFGEFWTDGG
jgi:hypothetical protein